MDGKQPAGSYAASIHYHDDIYYTESEINTKLSGKQDSLPTYYDNNGQSGVYKIGNIVIWYISGKSFSEVVNSSIPAGCRPKNYIYGFLHANFNGYYYSGIISIASSGAVGLSYYATNGAPVNMRDGFTLYGSICWIV